MWPQVRGVFVTGTDTGVGKTGVAAGLTAALRRRGVKAGYFKPLQSGCPEQEGRLLPTDAQMAQSLAGLDDSLELLTPITLRLPLAPAIAGREEGRQIDLGLAAAALKTLAAKYDFLVIEGAGGLYVPLVGTEFLVLDLIWEMGLPLLVVARAGLGTINHTVLTVKAAQQAGVEVVGVVLNRYPASPGLAERTNPAVIEALAGVPILGLVPEVTDLHDPAVQESFLAALTGVMSHPAMIRVLSARG